MKKLIILILIIFVGRYLYINHFKKEEWTGFFYPNAEDLSEWTESSEVFKDIESCRDWVLYQRNIAHSKNPEFYDNFGYSDYECGLNCEFRAEYGLNVCEKTVQ